MIKKIYFIFNNNILLILLSILFLLFIPFCYADNNIDDIIIIEGYCITMQNY